jgi:hypothetical protein
VDIDNSGGGFAAFRDRFGADSFKLPFGEPDGGSKPADLAFDLRGLEVDTVKLPLLAMQANDLSDRDAARNGTCL